MVRIRMNWSSLSARLLEALPGVIWLALVAGLEGLVRPLAQLRLPLGRELRVDGLGELRDAPVHGLKRRLAPEVGLRLRDLLGSGLVVVGLVVAVEGDIRALTPGLGLHDGHEPGVPALAVAPVVALAEGVPIYHLDAERFQPRRLLLGGRTGAGLAADRLAVPVALFGEHGHHVVLGEHVVVLAHERHGLEVQVHGVHGHDLRAPHVGLGLVLGDVGAHRRVGDRDSQREHRLDAAPALGLGQLLAVVVLRVEDLRDPGVVPAVHHVGVGLNESERPHGCGAAVSRDELVGLAIGHHDERRDLAVHLDAAGEPGHVSQLLAVLVAALDTLGERDSRRFHFRPPCRFCPPPLGGPSDPCTGRGSGGAPREEAKPGRA